MSASCVNSYPAGYLCIYILLRGDCSGLEVALRFLQLVSDQLLDRILLIFVYELPDGLPHALLG